MRTTFQNILLFLFACWATGDFTVSYKPRTQNLKQYDPNWDNLDSRPLPDWFDKAKIGIFIHWGVFSVPSMGTEWFWAFINDGGEVTDYLKNYFPPGFSYQEFAKDFTAEFFNASEWAELFAKAGAKYVILTSKHHEGFTMWPSKYSYSWNSQDVGPHRDLVGELGEAVRAQNLTYGLYHSLLEWYHPLYQEAKNTNYEDRRFAETKAMPELYELLRVQEERLYQRHGIGLRIDPNINNDYFPPLLLDYIRSKTFGSYQVNTYQPSIIWSDGAWEAPDTYWNATDFVAWLYNDSPVKDFVVTNDRWGKDITCQHGGYFTCNDRYSPTELQDKKWENAMSLDRTSFGYRRNAKFEDYLSTDELLTSVVQTVAYGGNILINIGPGHDGTIDMIFQERLLDLGKWLEINGEAIYESQPWLTAQKDSNNDQVYYTTRDGYIYALILSWPTTPDLNILSLGSVYDIFNKNTIVTLLGYTGTNLAWILDNYRNAKISLPDLASLNTRHAWVLKIDIQ